MVKAALTVHFTLHKGTQYFLKRKNITQIQCACIYAEMMPCHIKQRHFYFSFFKKKFLIFIFIFFEVKREGQRREGKRV